MAGIVPPFGSEFRMREMILKKEKILPGRARLKSCPKMDDGKWKVEDKTRMIKRGIFSCTG